MFKENFEYKKDMTVIKWGSGMMTSLVHLFSLFTCSKYAHNAFIQNSHAPNFPVSSIF